MTKEHELPFKTVHRLMKKNCECKVGSDSVEQMMFYVENVIGNVSFYASLYAEHDNRKTLNSNDVNLAIRYLYNKKDKL